ncbi:MAG TPA: lamin tail domain-containing protein [Pyrinomonadaceae bacterium]|nr:lamin tail domain-containing protein [Pyrinomonadaceae bacterium]
MLRSRRRSLLCCALAVLMVHAFVPYAAVPGPLNVAYAKRVGKKKRKKKSVKSSIPFSTIYSAPRNYLSFSRITSTTRPATSLPSPEQTITRTPRSVARAARVPAVYTLPVQKASAANGSTTVFSNSVPIEIPAINSSADPEPAIPYPSDIDVLGLTGIVTNVSVTIQGLTHSSPGDLDMLLLGPSGQTFHFWSDVGGANAVSDVTVTVADDGATSLPDSGPLVDGTTYKPFNADTAGDDFPLPAPGPPYNEPASAGAATFASVFNNLTADQANGTWSLFITDDSDGNGGTIAGGWSLSISTALPVTTAGQLIISEFRLSGPNGADDEFIELYNTTSAPLMVQAADGSAGLGVAASDGATRCTIPNATMIPAHGHYLCANDSASLPVEADNVYAAGIPDNAGIALFNNATGGASYNLANRLDAAGSASETNVIYKEGSGYPPLAANTLDHAFYRDLRSTGLPKDTGNNAADFVFVDTTATNAGAGSLLGAPGAENLASPIQQNANFPATLMAPCLAASTAPNRVRDLTSDPENQATFGTMSIRRVFTNNTANDVTRLRFRIIDMTTSPVPAGVADLRVLTSPGSTENDPCQPGELIEVAGLTLETPPAQPLGGGFNSTLSAGTIALDTPLAPNSSITVNFLLGVQQTGAFKFFVNVEALP